MPTTQASCQPRRDFASAVITTSVVATRTANRTCHHTCWRRHISSSWSVDEPGAGWRSSGWSAVTAPSCRAAPGPAEGPGADDEPRDQPGREDECGPAVLPHPGHLLALPVVWEEHRAHALGDPLE